ncbi:MAG: hypothetical protein ABSE40_09375 [Candidatus Sulfotelmatobacter sp.]|jgi:hypothetical protein
MQSGRDLIRGQPFKVRQLQNLATARTEASHELVHQPRHLRYIPWVPRQLGLCRYAVKIHPFVKVARCQVPAPVQRPVVRILQQPHFEYALVRVEPGQSAEEIKEHNLYDFLSLAWIVDDAHGDTEDQLVVAIKENGERILLAGKQTADELLVG